MNDDQTNRAQFTILEWFLFAFAFCLWLTLAKVANDNPASAKGLWATFFGWLVLGSTLGSMVGRFWRGKKFDSLLGLFWGFLATCLLVTVWFFLRILIVITSVDLV